MTTIRRLLAMLMITFFISVLGVQNATAQSVENPPAEGFNAGDSDPKAVEIADRVMEALGGRKNWDNTRYITWKFFGRRLQVWDKWSGKLRFEDKDLLVLMNINTGQGRAWRNDEAITNPDSLQAKLQYAKSAWINDSYWMFMPYKLKDSGVTLKYRGEETLENGRKCEVLQLTFQDVGDTPQNKYEVYVDRESKLVEQWSYFSDAGDGEPRFTLPWENWQRYGNILLADERGRSSKMEDIAVFQELPASVFESPEAVDVMSFVK
jgi:hypothetical protein